MKNKKTFELPDFFPMNTNNSVVQDSMKTRGQAEDHLNSLKQQAFCLNLMEFFAEFPNAYEIKLSIKYNNYNDYTLNVLINGKKNEGSNTMFAYLNDTIGYLDMEKIVGMNDQHFIVKKDNIHAAWEEWMGEENYQKWKSLDMEDKLREHTKPPDESKQKRQKI